MCVEHESERSMGARSLTALPDIRRALGRGQHPQDFGGQWVGSGAQRIAWLCGDYVVKDRVPSWRLDAEHNEFPIPCSKRDLFRIPREAMQRVGVLPPRQWLAAGWVIQPFYRPLSEDERSLWQWVNDTAVYDVVMHKDTRASDSRGTTRRLRVKLDICTCNMGVDVRYGTIHAFDW